MKKFGKISLIFIVVIILILSYFIYSSIAKENSTDIKEKARSEIQYFESKIIYMFNALNNLEFENYKISMEDISEKSKKSSESSSGAGTGGDSSDKGGEEGSSSGNSNTSSSNTNQSELDQTKKYSLNMQGVLTSGKEINWQYIKNEAEILQSSISSMILDLYEININNTDIVNFNKDYDNLLVAIKKNNKEDSLKELNNIYSYIPKFLKNCDIDEQYKTVINTKMNVFNAYSILDSEDWNSINNYLQTANDNFSKLLINANTNNMNQYTINKCYIGLNGLQNCIEKKDKEIFLIKYRNLLENLNNL